jgi:hypothetical protein
MTNKKYYFQSRNGSLDFVLYGTKEELKEKVNNELGGDKEEVIKRINEQLAEGQKKLEELKAKVLDYDKNPEEYLQTKVLIANYELGAYKGQQELKRVEELAKPDLVFFEFTPVDLGE